MLEEKPEPHEDPKAVPLAGRAREGKVKPDDVEGSTFTISNLGMFGVDRFTAIINPPETAILAAGKIGYVPTAVGMELAVRLGMNLTLSIDHRVVDGAYGARFLAEDGFRVLSWPAGTIRASGRVDGLSGAGAFPFGRW